MVLLVVFGCSKQELPKGMPKLVPVTIELTQEKKPIADAEITFIPEESITNWFAGGMSDKTGRVVPKTHGKYPGLAPGKFKVIVVKSEIDSNETVKDPEGKFRPIIYRLVDPIYTTLETTPLELEIVDGGNKTFSFDLGPAVRIKAKLQYP